MNRPSSPLILVTCSGQSSAPVQGPWASAAPGAPPPPTRRETVPANYVASVVLAGGSPLLLPNTGEAALIAAALESADGLLLSGGGDVAPSFYGQEAHPATAGVDPLRDDTERLAIGAAMNRGLPILAICRGIQMLNVAMGGTLLQDIPSRRSAVGDSGAVVHAGADHAIRVEPGSLLHQLWGRDGATVNSTHHQAVDRLAAGLSPIAWAPDGILEAAQSARGENVLAVQFHPERLSAQDPAMLAPFRWLVDQAARRG